MLSRRSSTASEKKRGKSMTRSKSPFRSFRFKRSSKASGEGGDLDDDDTMRTIGKILGLLSGNGMDILFSMKWRGDGLYLLTLSISYSYHSKL